MRYEDLADEPCSITRPLVVLGDRWTLVLLKHCFAGLRRFNALQAATTMSRSRLQDRLDRLVEHEILRRHRPDGAAWDEYRLTEKGMALYPVLMALRDWGDTYMAPLGQPIRYTHRTCAAAEPGEARVQLRCDCCGEPMSAREVTVEAGPGLDAELARLAGGSTPSGHPEESEEPEEQPAQRRR